MTGISGSRPGFTGDPGPSAGEAGAPFGPPGYAAPRADYAPGQDFVPPGKTPEQVAYERGQRDAERRLTTPRMTGWRAVCGICWGLWTLLFGVGAVVSLFQGSLGSFLLAAALAGLAGWYDYRIWTLKARRLTLFIIF
ncbi:MAG: hypothetical protein ACRDMI_07075 [Streptosporangiaceae bacterium]